MKRTISIVTAVHAPAAHFLPDAYKSLQNQELPAGWDWQWVVQEDGKTGEVAGALPDDPRISIEMGRPLGQGVARTYALGRASGDLVKVLDADDQLTRGALARDIGIMMAYPSVGWTTSRVLDLLPDGATAGFDIGDPDPGQLSGAFVVGFWRQHNYRAPVHPATLCIRKELVVALGGWMALPAGEDTGLLLSASTISAGYFIGEPGLLYRKWPGQVTAQPEHTDAEQVAARNAIIDARCQALTGLLWHHYAWATK